MKISWQKIRQFLSWRNGKTLVNVLQLFYAIQSVFMAY